jgi:hypothetical protein
VSDANSDLQPEITTGWSSTIKTFVGILGFLAFEFASFDITQLKCSKMELL